MSQAAKGATGPLADFVAALRQVRERAGNPTFETMSRRTGFSAATYCRVQSGTRMPTLKATLAYVQACGGDLELWERQHRQLRHARRTGTSAPFMPWRNHLATDRVAATEIPAARALAEVMRRLWVSSGLTLAEIATRTAYPAVRKVTGVPAISVSTISALCNPNLDRLPRRQTLYAFLLAVEAPLEVIDCWITVRNQLEGTRRGIEPLAERIWSASQLPARWVKAGGELKLPCDSLVVSTSTSDDRSSFLERFLAESIHTRNDELRHRSLVL